MRFIALFAVISLAEMATFFWVGSKIGFGWALLLAVATALIGSALVRRAGISVINRFREKANRGQVPGRELSDGAAVLVSGAFLISPGFITDILGFSLLIPAVRDVLYRAVSKRVTGRMSVFVNGRETVWSDRQEPTPSSSIDDIVDAEFEDLE